MIWIKKEISFIVVFVTLYCLSIAIICGTIKVIYFVEFALNF